MECDPRFDAMAAVGPHSPENLPFSGNGLQGPLSLQKGSDGAGTQTQAATATASQALYGDTHDNTYYGPSLIKVGGGAYH